MLFFYIFLLDYQMLTRSTDSNGFFLRKIIFNNKAKKGELSLF